MEGLHSQLAETLGWIAARWTGRPRIGLILGTGLGRLAEEIRSPAAFPFAELPHFAVSTALGHVGQLVCGEMCGVELVAMQGRLHAYEGYSLQQITYPVRVMKALGVEILIITSASGGMDPQHQPGQILLIDDHINLMGDNPLIGFNDDHFGPRFPDMSEPYDRELLRLAEKVAQQQRLPIQRAVYVGVKGPNYETRAEYRFFRQIGGDVVGMSTVPETLVAVQAGMKVLGFTTVTNVCLPDHLQPVTGEDVVQVADRASRQLLKLLRGVIEQAARDFKHELFR